MVNTRVCVSDEGVESEVAAYRGWRGEGGVIRITYEGTEGEVEAGGVGLVVEASVWNWKLYGG